MGYNSKAGYTNDGKTYSEVYGLQRGEIVEMVGVDKAQELAWAYIVQFPEVLATVKLRKSRARMMADVVRGRRAERGNAEVTIPYITHIDGVPVKERTLGNFVFHYRGTQILQWCPSNNGVWEPDAGEYEGTASTRNQRKLAREAIEEFRRVVFSL